MEKNKKIDIKKEKLIDDIEESMKDSEFRKGIKQFIKATSC